MESLEGKRGILALASLPCRSGPLRLPHDHQHVETLSAVPAIILEGGETYANRGTPKNGGTRLLCVSGHVNKPGIYEIPLGMNMKSSLTKWRRHAQRARKLKAVIPGGSSWPGVQADENRHCHGLRHRRQGRFDARLRGMVVIDEDTCMVDMARRIMHFYAHESCGWCIPCREGTSWLEKILNRFHAGLGRPEDIDMIGELSKNMLGRTFCPLGDAAAMPTISIVQKFRSEFEDQSSGVQVSFRP